MANNGISLRELARKLKVAPTLVYYHFGDLEARGLISPERGRHAYQLTEEEERILTEKILQKKE